MKFLKKILEEKEISYQREGKKIIFYPNLDSKSFTFSFPHILPHIKEDHFLDQIQRLNKKPDDFLILLIQAGYASLGYVREGKLVLHKGIQKYMVRKKRGKSQLTYLNQKGKSRMGSRIRLRESIEFFEEINQKLIDWSGELIKAKNLFYSCPIRLWPYLFKSKVKCPMQKNDIRWKKIPYDVHIPKLKELKRILFLIKSGKLYPVNQIPPDLMKF